MRTGTKCSQTAHVDWRIKSFETEARAAFAFLSDQGFTVAAAPVADPGRRPVSAVVRFQSPGVAVETTLSLGFAGEDGVHTSVLTTGGSRDFGPTGAHKGHEMVKALQQPAEEVRAALASL